MGEKLFICGVGAPRSSTVMLNKLIGTFTKYKADKDLEYGLALVQKKWLEYRSLNQEPPEYDVVKVTGPFVVPMLTQLASDPRWSNKPQALMLDLIFVVLVGDATTEAHQEKLRAMHRILGGVDPKEIGDG